MSNLEKPRNIENNLFRVLSIFLMTGRLLCTIVPVYKKGKLYNTFQKKNLQSAKKQVNKNMKLHSV